MSDSAESEDLQIPLLTEVVEDGEDGEGGEEDPEITQPHDTPPISRMEINTIVQHTLARHLVLASKEISDKINRQIKKRMKEGES